MSLSKTGFREEPLVSIVIPSRNSSETIVRCLQSIENQSYQNTEVVVVDNFSNDQTVEIVEGTGTKVLTAGPERSRQVNLGVIASSGKYVYRVDSDFIVGKEVVAECVESCEKRSLDGIAVHNTSDPTVSFWSRVRKFERDMHKRSPTNVAVRFVRRSVWQELGGLDETLIAGEDYDFHNRFIKQGHRFGFVDAEEIHLGEPKNLAEVVRKHYSYGKTILRYAKKDLPVAFVSLSPIRAGYLLNRRNLVDPEMIAGLCVYQLVRYVSATAGIFATLTDWDQKPREGKK